MDTAQNSPPRKPLYELLADSTFDEIKKSYRKLALKHHPDKIANSSAENDNGEKMREIALAYAILSDDKKRSIYDQYGMEGIDRSELLSKDQSLLPFVNKLWMCGIFGWITVLVVDYIVGIPIEWVIIVFVIPVILLRTEISRREKSIGFGLLCLVDLIIYYLVPSSYLKFLSNVLVITGLLAAQNSIIKFVDFTTLVWVIAVVVEYLRELDAQNFWIYLFGINVLAVSLFACGIFLYYFQTQFVLEGQPSAIAEIWSKLAPSTSTKPFSLLIILVPLWILDYFTTLNLESILFLALLIFTKVSNKEFKLSNAAFVLVASLAIYYFSSPSTYFHLANILIYYFMLRILSLEEIMMNVGSADLATDPAKDGQVNVDLDSSQESAVKDELNCKKEHGADANEKTDDSVAADAEEIKSASLLRASKSKMPSYSYFFMFFFFCYVEFNREISYYFTYLSILVSSTTLFEIFSFEFDR